MKYKYPWFRWAMSQSKTLLFVMLAKKSGIGTGDIKLVYLNLCEHAACNDLWGSVEGFDFDGSDCVWDLEEGTSRKVYDLLRQQQIIDEEDCLVGWNEEQGEAEEQTREERKREQSAERVRRHRERAKSKDDSSAAAGTPEQAEMPNQDVTQCNAVTHPVTPCNADALHVTQCNAVTHIKDIKEIKEIKDLKHTPLTPQGEKCVSEAPSSKTSSPKEENPKTGEEPQAEEPAQGVKVDLSHGNPAWKEFCYLYSLWPNQQNKEKAWREYAYLRARHLVPESYVLAEVIDRFKAEDRKWKRNYVPLMANWLRDRRWDDQPDKAPAPSYAPDENGRTRYVNENEQDYSRSYSGDLVTAL